METSVHSRAAGDRNNQHGLELARNRRDLGGAAIFLSGVPGADRRVENTPRYSYRKIHIVDARLQSPRGHAIAALTKTPVLLTTAPYVRGTASAACVSIAVMAIAAMASDDKTCFVRIGSSSQNRRPAETLSQLGHLAIEFLESGLGSNGVGLVLAQYSGGRSATGMMCRTCLS